MEIDTKTETIAFRCGGCGLDLPERVVQVRRRGIDLERKNGKFIFLGKQIPITYLPGDELFHGFPVCGPVMVAVVSAEATTLTYNKTGSMPWHYPVIGTEPINLSELEKDFRIAHVKAALHKARSNIGLAAAWLGMKRTTLGAYISRNKLKKREQ